MTPTQQHKRWRYDVHHIVVDLQDRWPGLECITYVDHPWPGWDARSFDVWEDAATWTPARLSKLREVRSWLMNMDYGPQLRHTILRHVLWTSFGGYSYWQSDDHSNWRRHLHVTYW